MLRLRLVCTRVPVRGNRNDTERPRFRRIVAGRIFRMNACDWTNPGRRTTVPTGACHDCGGRCVLKLHVEDGVVRRVETDDGEEPQLRACARGRAYRQRVYHDNRLKYPMKRIGARGEGKFERISWDDALNAVAEELTRIKDSHGAPSILHVGSGGNPGSFHRPMLVTRLLYMFGGCTVLWGNASCEGGIFACRANYGTLDTGRTRDDHAYSRLILMWGWNPVNTIYGTNTPFYLVKAKEAGARVVCVDPRFTDTVAALADQWIPIRPGTDVAMMVAMAYVILQRQMEDRRFLDTYTVGFDRFANYVLGLEDGVPKTPTWAEPITGVPAQVIESIAVEYASARPAALITGFAPGRTAYGEQFHRAAITLTAMTGNVGVHGGSAAGVDQGPLGVMMNLMILAGRNPIESGIPSLRGSLDSAARSRSRPHFCHLWDAILEGKAGGYPSDIELLYVTHANPLNQFPNTNKGTKALEKLQFIVVHEQFMTATARFADILLPINTIWERNDLASPWQSGAYYLYMNQAIEPMYESKTDFDIACELAPRLGVSDYSEKNEEEWLRELFNSSSDMTDLIHDYQAFRRDGVHKVRLDEPQLCFREQVQDPVGSPFPTPSGKIEIYSERIAEVDDPSLPPIPKYIETWESINDPLAKKYPLQLVTFHIKTRAHSCFDNVSWLRELVTQTIWINSLDARSRGIGNGDLVMVFNDRGAVTLPAELTERIMPGVVAIGEGAWHRPNESGVDNGGCPNVLTKDEQSPAGAFPSNTCLVQVKAV